MKNSNRARGAILPFVIGGTIVTAMVAVFMAYLLVSLGGTRQGTNANDAGNLNVARMAPTVRVPCTSSRFQQISEKGSFSLKSINRLWGQALLTGLNEKSMELQGLATSQSEANAAATWNEAQAISSSLAARLNNQKVKEPFFKNVSARNRITMLHDSQTLQPLSKWRTSCMNRGTESNLWIDRDILPPGTSIPDTDVVEKGGKDYLKGYWPIATTAGRRVTFVPFEYEKIPHSVSIKDFTNDTIAENPLQWTNPVPNAFESKSTVTDQPIQRVHTFDAVAIANTREKFQLSHPSGFVKFRLLPNTTAWYFYGIYTATIPVEHKYKSLNVTFNDPIMPGASFVASLDVGGAYHEASGKRTLYQAIFAMNDENHPMYAQLKALLLNRCEEIKPGTTWGQITELMHQYEIQQDVLPAPTDYVIRLKGSNLAISQESPPAAADGLLTPSEDKKHNFVNRLTSLEHEVNIPPHCFKKPVTGRTEWTHHIEVTPGTGANGCLLDISQVDTTRVDSEAIPGPLP